MKYVTKNRILRTVVALGCMTLVSHAEISSSSKKITVLEPADLPDAARAAGESLFLHDTVNGEFYLYIEQMNGTQLAIFDVTDLSHIKLKATMQLKGSGAFDFIEQLTPQTELMEYRDGKKADILDVTKPGAPEVRNAPGLRLSGAKQALVSDSTSEPSTPLTYRYTPAVAQDVKVVDTDEKGSPEVLTVVKQVTHQVTNEEMGTTFLLGSSGLSVIRRKDKETAYADHRQQMANQ